MKFLQIAGMPKSEKERTEGIGVLQLGGLSVSQAKEKVKRLLESRYQESEIDLTLGQTRSITISIIGEVEMPGTYTMSAFATVYNERHFTLQFD